MYQFQWWRCCTEEGEWFCLVNTILNNKWNINKDAGFTVMSITNLWVYIRVIFYSGGTDRRCLYNWCIMLTDSRTAYSQIITYSRYTVKVAFKDPLLYLHPPNENIWGIPDIYCPADGHSISKASALKENCWRKQERIVMNLQYHLITYSDTIEWDPNWPTADSSIRDIFTK